MEKIKIILVDDHQLVREAWKATLFTEDNFSIVGEAENVKDAIHLIKMTQHDIVILDINLKSESGVDVILEVNKFLGKPKIIVVSMMAEYSFIKNMLNLGVKGYVTKNSSIDELREAIEKVHAGQRFLCKEINDVIINNSLSDAKSEELSNKELIVLKEICKGQNTKEISITLNISAKTIEGHKTKIYKKLKTSNLLAIVNYAKQKGIIN